MAQSWKRAGGGGGAVATLEEGGRGRKEGNCGKLEEGMRRVIYFFWSKLGTSKYL